MDPLLDAIGSNPSPLSNVASSTVSLPFGSVSWFHEESSAFADEGNDSDTSSQSLHADWVSYR